MSSRWEFYGSLAVMFGVAVPVSHVGASTATASLIGLITTLTALTGYYWLRGISPMDFLWHGWDDDDLQPVLGGDSR